MCKYKDTTLGIKKLDFNVKRGAMAVFFDRQSRGDSSCKDVSRDKEYEQKAEGGLYDNG